MKPDGCFFDLDGTLCDTAPDIFGCWLAALKAAGWRRNVSAAISGSGRRSSR